MSYFISPSVLHALKVNDYETKIFGCIVQVAKWVIVRPVSGFLQSMNEKSETLTLLETLFILKNKPK